MSKREYPYVTREKYRSRARGRCACCAEAPAWTATVQLSIFRGDDDVFDLCDTHISLARTDYNAFVEAAQQRHTYLSEVIQAQHEETGRMWSGQRRNLPPRYLPVSEKG